jgi:hypothetical protein
MVRSSLPKIRPANQRALCHPFCYRGVTRRGPASKSPRGHPKVTVTSAKLTVTLATRSKIEWQAGMSKRMSDVRSYVGGYERRVYVNAANAGRKDREK